MFFRLLFALMADPFMTSPPCSRTSGPPSAPLATPPSRPPPCARPLSPVFQRQRRELPQPRPWAGQPRAWVRPHQSRAACRAAILHPINSTIIVSQVRDQPYSGLSGRGGLLAFDPGHRLGSRWPGLRKPAPLALKIRHVWNGASIERVLKGSVRQSTIPERMTFVVREHYRLSDRPFQ
jgi:hypothetical protein